MIEFLKNGSGIHIKKKNRGSFTRWCGGNVTEECIRRGKSSSNPKIRKKATFADNARHFKHEQGGIIKAKDGFKWSDILNNSELGNLFSLGIQAYSSNKIADNNQQMQDASLEMEKNKELQMVPQLANQMFPQMMGPINPENPNEKGGVYAKYLYGKLESMLNGQINQTYENKKRINRLQTQSLKDQNLMNVLSGVGDAVSSIASYIGNKKNSTTPTTSNYIGNKKNSTTPTTSNYQLDSFWTNPSLS